MIDREKIADAARGVLEALDTVCERCGLTYEETLQAAAAAIAALSDEDYRLFLSSLSRMRDEMASVREKYEALCANPQ